MNKILPVDVEQLLFQVSKPARYIGNEINVIIKKPQTDNLRLALVFPDVYEIGMSNFGLKLLYNIANNLEFVTAERAYSPWIDMEEILRREKIPVFTLENRLALNSFDVIGFSLQHELLYTNVLNILDLSEIPVLASERDDNSPLIIAGGPCTVNPEPMADFIDLFVIGDGEEVLEIILKKLYEMKKSGAGRIDRLKELATLEGVYIPRSRDNFLQESEINNSQKKIKRLWIDSLNTNKYSESPLVPITEITQDRLNIELIRGCTHGCRFCQAGYIYRPVRELGMESIIDFAEKGIASTGLDAVNLLSLSSSDYSLLAQMSGRLSQILEKKKIAISLPSLRIDKLTNEVADNVKLVRKTGFTFAPETGSERLRWVINKPITDLEILNTIKTAFNASWNLVKLYFMIGLPTETWEDVIEIHQLMKQIIKICHESRGGKKVNASIGIFVPKSHTPFQWEEFGPREELEEKLLFLKNNVRWSIARVNYHKIDTATIEAVLARGDRKISQVILAAYKLGARFDGWNDQFSYAAWMDAFSKTGINYQDYLKPKNFEHELPWDFIDAGVSRKFLQRERYRAMNGEITPDCRSEGCCGCGLPGSDHIKLASSVAATVSTHSTESTELTRKWGRERERVSSRIAAPFYFRVRYGKSSEIRFISHLDITRLWTRILRMSNLPIIYSGGFFPRPEIDFGPALPVGVTSKVELMDFAIDSQFKGNVTNILLKAAYKYLPVFDVLLRVPDAPSLCSQIKRASYNVVFPEDFWSVKNIEFRSALECFKIQKEIFHTVKRENKKDKIVDLKKAIIEIKEIHDGFSMLLSVGDENGQNTNPDTVLMNIFKIEPVEMGKTMVERTGFFNNQLNSV